MLSNYDLSPEGRKIYKKAIMLREFLALWPFAILEITIRYPNVFFVCVIHEKPFRVE